MIAKARKLNALYFVGLLFLAAPAVAAPKAPVIACPEIASGNYKCIDAKAGLVMPLEYIQSKDSAGNAGFQVNLNGNITNPKMCANGVEVIKTCTPEERKLSAAKAAECQRKFGKGVFVERIKTELRPTGVKITRKMEISNRTGISTLVIDKDKVQPEVLNVTVGLKRGSEAKRVSKLVCYKAKGK